MIYCARDCGRQAPIDPDELTADGGGDPTLLPVLAPPEGWIGDPDGDGIVCGACAEPEEISAFMADLSSVEADVEGGEPDDS